MRHFTLKLSGFVLSVIVVTGLLLNPVKAYGIPGLGELVSGIIQGISEVSKDAEELAQIAILVRQGGDIFGKSNSKLNAEVNEKGLNLTLEQLEKAKEHLQKFTRALRNSNAVYYSAKRAVRFYTSIKDYWSYCKESGFSNSRKAMRTVRTGLRLSKGVVRDVLAVGNIIMGLDEDGNVVEFDSATRSSHIRALYTRINKACDTWVDVVEVDGLMSAGMVSDKAAADALMSFDGMLSPASADFSILKNEGE